MSRGNGTTTFLSTTFHVVLTGGAGFIGGHLARAVYQALASSLEAESSGPPGQQEHRDLHLYVVDKLDYCASRRGLQELLAACPPRSSKRGGSVRITFVPLDILDLPVGVGTRAGWGDHDRTATALLPDHVHLFLHVAALSSVDASFADPCSFTRNNVVGTQCCLEFARARGCQLFLYMSTDEVYGSAGPEAPPCFEDAPHLPTNPYAASKSGAESLVTAYHASYGIPCLIVRSNNIYGPMQYPEKIIPRFLRCLLAGRPCPLHGSGRHTRRYLYVTDLVEAIVLLLQRHCPGFPVCGIPSASEGDATTSTAMSRPPLPPVYNVGTDMELSNLALFHALHAAVHGPEEAHAASSRLTWSPDRPFNDERYAIDSSRIERELGWRPCTSFAEGLALTLAWYVQEHAAGGDWWADEGSADLRSPPPPAS